jgi:hypothetical protein
VEATLLRTPLYARHVALGARMVPFAGYEMPVQYEGVIPEHRAVRTDAGAFDVSHMGEIHVDGPTGQAFLQSVLSNDIDNLAEQRSLEKAGYVTRTTDPNDRRRQQVRIRGEAVMPPKLPMNSRLLIVILAGYADRVRTITSTIFCLQAVG